MLGAPGQRTFFYLAVFLIHVLLLVVICIILPVVLGVLTLVRRLYGAVLVDWHGCEAKAGVLSKSCAP